MIEEMKRVCELQPLYSPSNTLAMRERGQLIRQALPRHILGLKSGLVAALGDFGAEFGVGASDGIGRKTEAPWVRFHSKSMSPNPRNGFYVVIHFAADGSAVFITVGCGSTIWTNGELKSVSDEELHQRTRWARQVIADTFGGLTPFVDEIQLGAKARLPRTFEKATALALRIPVDQLEGADLPNLLIQAAERLREIYEAQRIGRHLTAAEYVELELDSLSRPTSPGSRGQGYGLSPAERRAVEQRAMRVADEWLRDQGFKIKDTSRTSPFDYRAVKAGLSLKVEVKGTTSEAPTALFMTKNEVTLHQNEMGQTALLVVSNIKLRREKGVVVGVGGALTAEIGWNIGEWDLTPIAYRVSRREVAA